MFCICSISWPKRWTNGPLQDCTHSLKCLASHGSCVTSELAQGKQTGTCTDFLWKKTHGSRLVFLSFLFSYKLLENTYFYARYFPVEGTFIILENIIKNCKIWYSLQKSLLCVVSRGKHKIFFSFLRETGSLVKWALLLLSGLSPT